MVEVISFPASSSSPRAYQYPNTSKNHHFNNKGKGKERVAQSITNRSANRRQKISFKNNIKVELGIACHNINGLRSNKQKLEALYEWALLYDIDVLGLAETNISSKEGTFAAMNFGNYRSFWSSANPNKKKGSGVGLLINKQWERHLGQIERKSEYLIIASFMFKQLELIVMMVYLPPNNKEERKEIQKEILKRYMNRSKKAQLIIMGDFNCISDPLLDKSHSTEN